MGADALYCRDCGSRYELGNYFDCQKCNGILNVHYDYNDIETSFFYQAKQSIWDYAPLLPILNQDYYVSLGEGSTPLIEASNLFKNDSFTGKIYLKLENLNPTGSFKDRPIAVAISKAKEFGADTIILSSSGNASASAAAYAARAGIKCIVCIPQSTDIGKINQAIAHGATVILIKGSYSNAYQVVKEATRFYNWPNLSTTFINPYSVEGNKTAAYEIWKQLGFKKPDIIIVPIGAGPLLVGMAKGFSELINFGLIENMPRLVGVQSSECAPIAEAYSEGKKEVFAWQKPIKTIATGIADPLVGYEADGTLTLNTILNSNGIAIALSEEEIIAASDYLAQKIGVYAEPTAATSIGAVKKLCSSGFIMNNDLVVCLITGHGLKYARDFDCQPETITGMEELKTILEK